VSVKSPHDLKVTTNDDNVMGFVSKRKSTFSHNITELFKAQESGVTVEVAVEKVLF
jgi:hypothetical protein